MAHPTQPVPKSSAWEQAQGTMLHQLHLSNCIVVIEIWKPRDLIFLLLCVSHSPFYLLLLVHSLALTRYRPFFFNVESLRGCHPKIYELQTKDCDSQAHNYHDNNTNKGKKVIVWPWTTC